MFLAYVDDSGTRNTQQAYQLITTVIVPDSVFRGTEMVAISSLAAFMQPEQFTKFWPKFTEFKGHELYGARGPFEGIEKPTCLRIMDFLLNMVARHKFPVIFGALNKAEWEKRKSKSGDLFIYGASTPIDICFRLCLQRISLFIENNWPGTFAVLIADDSKGEEKELLKKAFYEYRERLDPTKPSELPYLHDDMYFGNSKYSIGIQLADLCGFVIARHLEGDQEIEPFYERIKNQIFYSRIDPAGIEVHPIR